MGWKRFIRTVAPVVVGAMLPGAGAAIGSAIGASPMVGTMLLGGALGALGGGGGRGAMQGAALSTLGAAGGSAARNWMGGAEAAAPAAAASGGSGSMGALSALGLLAAAGPGQQEAPEPVEPELPEGWNSPLQEVDLERTAVAPTTAAPYYTFGTVPFLFFEGNKLPDVDGNDEDEMQPASAATPYARGGVAALGAPYMNGGRGDGRSDTIPAQLSPNEYVIDAETVSLLGDGNPDAGADRLDRMRASVRRHKGRALARGDFSPDAEAPERYLAGGM